MIHRSRLLFNILSSVMREQSLSGRGFALALIMLLAITWLPLFGFHVSRSVLPDNATGTVLVIFPMGMRADKAFVSILDANGTLVRPVRWLRNAWIVHSNAPDFVSHLRLQGAWGSFSPDLMKFSAVLRCFSPSDVNQLDK